MTTTRLEQALMAEAEAREAALVARAAAREQEWKASVAAGDAAVAEQKWAAAREETRWAAWEAALNDVAHREATLQD